MLKTIGNYSFKNCTSLTFFNLPYTVTSIGNYAFSDCNNLAEFKISSNSRLTTIKSFAFNNCTKLKEIFIPSAFKDTSANTIDKDAFKGCVNLKLKVASQDVKNALIALSLTDIKSSNIVL